MKKKEGKLGWANCEDCSLKAGAKIPKHGHMGITVHEGLCPVCGKKTWLIPERDFDWPDGRKAWFD